MKIESTFINIEYGSIYLKQWQPLMPESNTAIVLLHDSLGCSELWRDFPQHIAQLTNRRVISYDGLGFGQSTMRIERPSIKFIEEEAARYFPAIKKALSLHSHLLFGYSVGGAMALNIAATDKNCVGVISMSAQAFVEQKTIDGILDAKAVFQSKKQMKKLEKWHGNRARWILSAWIDVWTSAEFANWSLSHCIEKDEYGSIAFPNFIASNVSGKSS